MNGDAVLFGVLPFDVTAAAYSFPCPVCGRTRAHQPETPCDGCKKATRRPTRTAPRWRTKATP